MQQQQPPEMGKVARTLIAAATVASLLLPSWYMIPQQERLWLRLSLAGKARAALARLARSEGHRGMRDELAGRDPAPRYGLAYACSRTRDRLDQAVEAWRP